MSEAGPPPGSYEQPRRYEIPERFRPAPRAGDTTVPGPRAERASAPTEPLERPVEAPPQRGPGGPQRPGGPPSAGPQRPGGPPGPGGAGGLRGHGGPAHAGPGRPAGPPPPVPGPEQRRPDTKIILLAIAVVVVVVGAALGAYLALSGGDSKSSGSSDATVTRQTADKIYTALNAHDETALKSLRCNPSSLALGSIAGTLGSVREARATSAQRVSGHDATSAGTMLVSDSADPSARQTRVTFQLHLQKHGSRWCYAGLNPSTYTPAGPVSSSAAPTAAACHTLIEQSQLVALMIETAVPAPASVMPESFPPPHSGTVVGYCRVLFRPEESKRVGAVAIYTGVRAAQYVNQLRTTGWRLVGSSATRPEFDNPLGVHITVVQSGPQLVAITGRPAR